MCYVYNVKILTPYHVAICIWHKQQFQILHCNISLPGTVAREMLPWLWIFSVTETSVIDADLNPTNEVCKVSGKQSLLLWTCCFALHWIYLNSYLDLCFVYLLTKKTFGVLTVFGFIFYTTVSIVKRLYIH